MTISMDKKYRTRDGREVRIYAVDGRTPAGQVHGAVNYGDGWKQFGWYISGQYDCSEESCLDLIEVKPRIYCVYWVNVYPNYGACCHKTKEEADKCAGQDRIACVKVVIDCEEGEGL